MNERRIQAAKALLARYEAKLADAKAHPECYAPKAAREYEEQIAGIKQDLIDFGGAS